MNRPVKAVVCDFDAARPLHVAFGVPTVRRLLAALALFACDVVRAAGLIDSIYVYGFDERDDAYFPGIARFWRRFKEDFPDVPMMTTAFMYRRRAEGKEVPDWTVTDWHCPVMPFWRAALTDELHALGKKAWWYICCGPVYPRLNVGNEHPPIDSRLLAWQQYAEKHNVRDGDKVVRAWVDLVKLAGKKKRSERK